MIDSFKGEYSFLSNFFMFPITFENKIYPSVEHAYQAAKTFDEDIREKIRKAKSAGLAKRKGQKIKLRDNWEEIKISVMKTLVKEKFQNPILKQKLIETKNNILIEGNTWGDTFWGVCKGVGENHLGKILMEIRDGD